MFARPSLGFALLGLISVLYEPLRQALWRLGDEVGGVGGVGGLTNQFGSSTGTGCSAGDDDGATPYCFRRGWLGFTPFAGVMLLLLTSPLLFTSLVAHCNARKDFVKAHDAQQAHEHEHAHEHAHER